MRRARATSGVTTASSSCCPRCRVTALENVRLRSAARARRNELKGSGARVVAAADAERRRLERDLHDGAQQRLVSLSLQLQLLAKRTEADPEAKRLLGAAQHELAASLAELRELARGIHPAVLSDHGLLAALEALAARAPLPVDVSVSVDRRPPASVEIAAYYLVSEALTNIAKHAGAASSTVNVVSRDGLLVVEAADDGVGGADPAGGSGLRGLADRVQALGGRLSLTSPPAGGTRVRAEIPCDAHQRSDQPADRS